MTRVKVGAMRNGSLAFTGIVIREGKGFYSLCPELDVASEGHTVAKAKAMLRQAVTGYLETCMESNLPYLRPTPREEDPRVADAEHVIETFRMKVSLAVKVHG